MRKLFGTKQGLSLGIGPSEFIGEGERPQVPVSQLMPLNQPIVTLPDLQLTLTCGTQSIQAHEPDRCEGENAVTGRRRGQPGRRGDQPDQLVFTAGSSPSSSQPSNPRNSDSLRKTLAPLPLNQALLSQTTPSIMAFQRADPNPFKPRGMNILNIPNRPVMVRTMAPRRPVLRNEDLAVLTIHPIPGNPLFFPTVEEVINDFCVDKRVEIKEVQRCHMGQAFVRFQHEFDRDRFVLNSPHLFGGSYFTFVKHNQARNWRSVMFNHECWIMMLGLPEDYYEDDFIDAVLGPFARLISWYKERTAIDSVVVTRLIVKARVVDLEDIPHFSVFTDSLGLNGQSWSVQCEILQSEMLGHHAPGEDDVPQLPEDGGPLLYDFFGLGQQVLAPVAQNGEQVGQHMPQQGDDEHQLPGWGAWQQNNHLHNLNLNLAPVEPANVIQDLNEPPPVEDPMEMIIDPAPDVGQDLVLQIAQPVLAQQPFLPNNQVDEEELQMPAIFPVMQVEEEVMMEEDEIMEQMAQYEQEDDIMEPLAQHEQEMQHVNG